MKNEFMYLNSKDLQISPDIQRKLNMNRVMKIVNSYDPHIANPIKVSERENGRFIFDGMHTLVATRIVKGTDDFPILCRVYHGLTKEDEAMLFAAQFGSSEPIGMFNKLRALAVAKDPTVLEFMKVTTDNGFAMDFSKQASRNGRIEAVCSAYKAFSTLGPKEYGRMLKILHRTWAGESWSVSKYMLGGMTRLISMYEFNMETFIRVFRKVTKEGIEKTAAAYPSMAIEGAYATALAEIFDNGNAIRERD